MPRAVRSGASTGALLDLTEAQRRAVEHDGRNLQLIACAGSGKTEVVARRVAHLLTPGRSDSLEPRNIVAFTFTDKAAAELKERTITRTRGALGEIHGMADMFVGTIHAFCLDLLQAEAPEYLRYEVLNEVQQTLFVDRHSRASGLTSSQDLAGTRLRRYVDTNHYLNALAILREAEVDESELAGCSVVSGLNLYRNLLQERSYFDYSSIRLRLAGRGEKIHERVCRCGGRVPIHEVWRARRTTATIRTDPGVNGTLGTCASSNASNEASNGSNETRGS